MRRVRRELELHCLEIHEQRVRHDVVRAIRLAVELAGLRFVDAEEAVVEHQVAADVGQPLAAQAAQQLPQLFDDEVRVAVALQRQVAVELAAVERAQVVNLRGPRVGGAEILERAPRRDDLHHRRGAARCVRQVSQDRLGSVDGLHDDADVVLWNIQPGQQTRDLGRQLRRGRAREEAGEKQRHDLHGRRFCTIVVPANQRCVSSRAAAR